MSGSPKHACCCSSRVAPTIRRLSPPTPTSPASASTRLGRADIEVIVARLGGDSLPSDTVETIIARTDGVPLFVEELTKAVLETGETAIPASLHDSLIARLDRIPEAREIAQIAACIGREFGKSLLVAIQDGSEEEVQSALDMLLSAGLITRHGDYSSDLFAFKHALLRDAAYTSLLRKRRRYLHERVLGNLIALNNRVNPEIKAHHSQAAGNYEQAATFFAEAAKDFEMKSALAEAASNYRSALDAFQHLPSTRTEDNFALELWLGLCRVLLLARGHSAEETVSVHETTRDLATDLGHSDGRFQATLGLYYHWQADGDYEKAAALANDLIEIASAINEPMHTIAATRAKGAIELYRGDFPGAYGTFSKAIEIYERADVSRFDIGSARNPFLGAHYNRDICAVILGLVDTARRRLERHLKEVANIGKASDKANILALASASYFLLGDEPSATQLAQELLSVATRHGLEMYHLLGEVQAMPESFTWDDLMRRNTPTMMAAVVVLMRVSKAVRSQDINIIDDAREALQVLERSGVRWMSAEIMRMLARADLALGHGSHAMSNFEQAVDLARSQGALWFELRASLDITRLKVELGDHREAREALYPVYERFSEGFESAELKEAKTLLQELA